MKKINSNFDFLKFILCLMIVCIHTNILQQFLYPWLRLAVPIFFTLSSYFFFSKYRKVEDKGKCLKDFEIRNFKLYAFWLIVLFPWTLKARAWFTNRTFIQGFGKMMKHMIFASTFRASWFIMALIICVPIVCLLSKKLNNKILVIIGLVVYILVCMDSSYNFLFGYTWYSNTIAYSYNSFPVGFLFVILGKCFADGFRMNSKVDILGCIVSLVFLYCEFRMVRHFLGIVTMDSLLMLAPFTLFFFDFVVQLKPISFKLSIIPRKMSTIIYASHCTIAAELRPFLQSHGIVHNSVLFLCTLGSSLLICVIILLLEKKIKFLKYSY